MAVGTESVPRRAAALAVLLVLALAATGRPAGAAAAPAATQPFERALGFYAQGDLRQAEVNLQQALAADPADRRACTLLSVVQRERGQKPAACGAASPLPATLSAAQLFQAVAARNPEISQAVMQVVQARAELAAEERVLDALVGPGASPATRESFRKKLRTGELDEEEIEIEVQAGGSGMPMFDIPGMPGAQRGATSMGDIFGKLGGGLAKQQATELGALAIRAALERHGLLARV